MKAAAKPAVRPVDMLGDDAVQANAAPRQAKVGLAAVVRVAAVFQGGRQESSSSIRVTAWCRPSALYIRVTRKRGEK